MNRKGFHSEIIRGKSVLASFWNLEASSSRRQDQKVTVNLEKCLHTAWRNLHIGFLNESTFYSINWRFPAAGGEISFLFCKEKSNRCQMAWVEVNYFEFFPQTLRNGAVTSRRVTAFFCHGNVGSI